MQEWRREDRAAGVVTPLDGAAGYAESGDHPVAGAGKKARSVAEDAALGPMSISPGNAFIVTPPFAFGRSKESSSFLKKRTKKLLRPWPTLPERTATATQKSSALGWEEQSRGGQRTGRHQQRSQQCRPRERRADLIDVPRP
jgi:hypothetical protein